MRYFKVKIGYGKNDFISITEEELQPALKAQGTGSVAVLKNGTVAGNSIMAILPDWNKVLGYNIDYDLNGEDYKELGKWLVEDYQQVIQTAVGNVQQQLTGKRPEQITGPVKVWSINGKEVAENTAKAYLTALKAGHNEITDKNGNVFKTDKVEVIENDVDGKVYIKEKVVNLPYVEPKDSVEKEGLQ